MKGGTHIMKKELLVGIVGVVGVLLLAFFYYTQDTTPTTTRTNSSANTTTSQTNADSNRSTNSSGNANANTSVNSSTDSSLLKLSPAEVAKHNSAADCWLIIQGNVYDVTQYIFRHEGGADRIISVCGSDATTSFLTQGGEGSHSSTATRDLTQLLLGKLNATITL